MPDGVATKAALRRLPRMMVVLLLLLGFPLLWALPPLNDWVAAESLWELGQRLQRTELSLLFSTFAFVILTVLMFPVTVLIFVAVWLFGPWLGFAFSLLGSLASASLSFAIGRWLGGDKIRWFVRARLEVLSRALVERGFLTTVTLRIIPAAPFGLVNLILGGSGLRRRDFLLGTLVGMAPGLLIMAHTFHRVIAAVKHPSPLSIVVAAFVVVAMAIVLSWFRRLLQRATRGDSLT